MSEFSKENRVRILLVLERAKGAAPIGYISKHSGLENPCELLQQLEKDGLVCRLPPGLWCPSLHPLFELTSKAKSLLQQVNMRQLDLQLR